MSRMDLLPYSNWTEEQKSEIQKIIEKLGEDKFAIHVVFKDSKEQADNYKGFLDSIDVRKLHKENLELFYEYERDFIEYFMFLSKRISEQRHQAWLQLMEKINEPMTI